MEQVLDNPDGVVAWCRTRRIIRCHKTTLAPTA